MRFSFSLEANQFLDVEKRFWRKPFTQKFIDSDIRKRVSTYSNYWRFVWWRWDATFQWEGGPLRWLKDRWLWMKWFSWQ